jgi:cytochrome c oxidase subunit 2
MKYDFLYVSLICLSILFPTNALSQGDPIKGKSLYGTCVACHGQRPLYDAPRLAGQHDWYLIRQLQNFKDGIRGYTGDKAGLLMRFQLVDLDKTQMINDLAAYIGTLER